MGDGGGSVHLTGNLMDEQQGGEDMPFDMMGSESEASEEESETEDAGDRIEELNAEGKTAGKRKTESKNVVAKKAKVDESLESIDIGNEDTDNDDDEDDEDDDDDEEDDDDDDDEEDDDEEDNDEEA